MVMTYFVRAKLSRSQALLAAALFVWSYALTAAAAFGGYYRSFMFQDRISAIDSNIYFFLSPIVITALASMMFVGILVVLYFLHHMWKIGADPK